MGARVRSAVTSRAARRLVWRSQAVSTRSSRTLREATPPHRLAADDIPAAARAHRQLASTVTAASAPRAWITLREAFDALHNAASSCARLASADVERLLRLISGVPRYPGADRLIYVVEGCLSHRRCAASSHPTGWPAPPPPRLQNDSRTIDPRRRCSRSTSRSSAAWSSMDTRSTSPTYKIQRQRCGARRATTQLATTNVDAHQMPVQRAAT